MLIKVTCVLREKFVGFYIIAISESISSLFVKIANELLSRDYAKYSSKCKAASIAREINM